jgi:glucose-6-phosphate isomerase
MTAACRDLKGAIRVGRRMAVVIAVGMLMIGIMVMRFGKLLEKMVHLVGRRID